MAGGDGDATDIAVIDSMPVARGVGLQVRNGFVVRGEAAGEYVADAATMRQADVPDPASALRRRQGRAGNRGVGLRIGHLHGQGRVDHQLVIAPFETDAIVAGQQAGGKTRAVDKQIPANRRMVAGAA